MIIKRKRINSIKKYFGSFSEDTDVCIVVPADEDNLSRLFDEARDNGTSVVPEPIGPITRFNLYGKDVIHKEKPKVIRDIERDFHIVDWHGTDHYGICFQRRFCYPKEYVFPPLIRIILDSGKLRSNLIKIRESVLLKHTVNLFLELFGFCEVVDKDSTPITRGTKIKEISWRILPPGKYPWEKAEKALGDYFDKHSIANKEILKKNHSIIAEFNPDFLAIGENSFYGYVVYGFSTRNIYVFESNQPGNATYVFKGEWENASKLTKFDIISGNLCYKRIIHSSNWEEKVRETLGKV